MLRFILRAMMLLGGMVALALGVLSYRAGDRRKLWGEDDLSHFWRRARQAGDEARERLGGVRHGAGKGLRSVRKWATREPLVKAPVVREMARGGSGGLSMVGSWIGGTVYSVTRFPGLVLGAIVGAIAFFVGSLIMLATTALVMAALGYFILYVFAPEMEQRRKLYRQARTAYYRLRRLWRRAYQEQEPMRGPGEQRAA